MPDASKSSIAGPPALDDATLQKLRKSPKQDVVDGNTATAWVAYGCTDCAFIYPISPSSTMSEMYDAWSAANQINIFGQVSQVKQLQSEAGAAGAVHGSVSTGAVTTTFTASQGLLLMIPPMYKIAGELMPCVFHVSARAIAGQALCIFGDHCDVMAVRQCGWAMIASSSVQEAQDIAAICHMATLEAEVPFVHFFDGYRTSHEIQKIDVLSYETLRGLMNYEAINKFRSRSLNPTHPFTKGSAQGPEVYFQNVETANPYYARCTDHIINNMEKFGKVTGRVYKPYMYYGHPEAEDVVVIMGSGGCVARELVEMESENGEKVGALVVKMFRPWSCQMFVDALPKSVKRVAVLDRSKEPAAIAEPLRLDVSASFEKAGWFAKTSSPYIEKIIGGRYGLGSRDFTPGMVKAVIDNLRKPESSDGFTVGIDDDVTFRSLDLTNYWDLSCVPKGTTECLFWGMGSDGTVGANKNVIKILGLNTDMYVQGYFAYSAHKAGGITMSHLRFGPKPINSVYLLQQAEYIAVHRDAYIHKFDVAGRIKTGGTFVLNCPWSTREEIEANVPGQLKRVLARQDAKFYVIDANRVAAENGMGRRINNVLMTSFFKLSGVLPFEEAIALFKKAIQDTYAKKGPHVVEANWKCVDAAVAATIPVDYDRQAWMQAEDSPSKKTVGKQARVSEPPAFISAVMVPLETSAGENLPVSAFVPTAGGIIPPGTAGYEKRAIALNIPIVDMDKCTQCNQCSFVCPHAAIRPFLINDTEGETAPDTFVMKKCKGPTSLAAYKYRIQVSPFDCTGCELCYMACPDDALTMVPLPEMEKVECKNWDYAINLSEKHEDIDEITRLTLKGSQFYTPLMEFSGACEGCGETPYVKLLTQLFGERIVIANATGCSSIWGASYPSNAYTTNQKGQGPAWGNSLFEDNAEYGMGMAIARAQRRDRLHDNIRRLMEHTEASNSISEDLRGALSEWYLHWKDGPLCTRLHEEVKKMIPSEVGKHQLVQDIANDLEVMPKISQWILGGDGWAYDIGFGGVDHVIATGLDVNILVMDTEGYSNTGGQSSKATPIGAVHKFSSGGRARNKKDFGALCMEYGDVYVANICSSANMTQSVRAFIEAESYEGPSVIMAYSPCIEHQYIKPFNLQIEHCKAAVDSGYWPLYRYDPRLLDQDLPAFQLDSKKIKVDVVDLIRRENRFASLKRINPKFAVEVEERMRQWVRSRHERLQLKARKDVGGGGAQVKPELVYNVLYGTDTGNAENLSNRVGAWLTARGLHANVQSLGDVTVEEVAGMLNVIIVCATAGQGAMPPNAKAFWDELNSPAYQHNTNLFENMKFAVMGLGDANYVFFNKAAKDLDAAFARLGGKRVCDLGLGDDQHEDGFEAGYQEWSSEYIREARLPPPLNENDDPLPQEYQITEAAPTAAAPTAAAPTAAETKETETAAAPAKETAASGADGLRGMLEHDGFKPVTVVVNKRITPEEHDVDVRHLEFDLTGSHIKYHLGDSLALMPTNPPDLVAEFCQYIKVDPETHITVTPTKADGPRGGWTNAKYAAALKHKLTYRQLFAEVLDLFSKVPRQFWENAFRYATDPAEKAELKEIVTSKAYKMRAMQRQFATPFDVMKEYTSIKLTPAQLLDLVPILKPRYYSIASSQKFVGDNKLELCIGVVTMAVGDRVKLGLMTGAATRLVTDPKPPVVNAAVKPTAFTLPPTELHPIVLAAVGTGLAPFRSFIQQKAYVKRQGKAIGPVALYFGCRYSTKDYLYGDEIKAFAEEGVISDLQVAFSRERAEKDYIQHHIVRTGKRLYELLVNQDGYFYLCGSAKQVPIDVRRAVRTVLMEHGCLKEEEAEKLITDWQIKGKYNCEAW